MKAAACCKWEVLPGGLFVFYGGKGEFTDDTYERWYGDLVRSGAKRYLGGTANGFAISGAQRKRGRDFFLQESVAFATVTDDPLVRGFVTAAAWFGINIAAYGWGHLGAATAHLQLDHNSAERAQATLLRLRAAVECRALPPPARHSGGLNALR